VSKDFQVQLLKKYQATTKEDILATLRKYFLPLFDPASSVAVVVTAPSKIEEIAGGLASANFDVEKRSLDVEQDELGDNESASGSEVDSSDNDSR